MADERIGGAHIELGVDDAKYRADLRDDERLFDSFTRKVNRTKVVGSVDLNMKKFEFAAQYVYHVLRDLGRKKTTTTLDMNIKPFVAKMAAATGMKKIFDKMMSRTPGTFITEMSKLTLRIGPFTASLSQALTLLIALGPILQGLVGGLGAFAGVLGSAAGGLGALGLAAAGGAAAGLSGVAMLIPSLLRDFKNLTTMHKAYRLAVLKSGEQSDQAKGKLKVFNHALGQVTPTTRAAFMELGELRERFRQLRQAARPDFFNAMGAAIEVAEEHFVRFRRTTLRNFHEVSMGFQAWMRGLQTAEAGKIFSQMAGNMRMSIRPLMDGLGDVGAVLARIGASASRWLPTFSQQFRNWASALSASVQPGEKLNDTVDRMVSRLRSVGNLLRSFGSLMMTIFRGGAQEGQNLTDSLTKTFDRWNAFLQTDTGRNKMAEFFKRASDTLRELGPALINTVSALSQFAAAVQPISKYMLQAIAAISKFFSMLAGVHPILAFTAAMALLLQRVGLLIPLLKAARFAVVAFFALTPGFQIVLALTAIAAGLMIAWKRSETFRTVVKDVFRAVRNSVVTAVDALLGGFSSMLTAIGKVDSFLGGKLPGNAAKGAEAIDKLRGQVRGLDDNSTAADRKLGELKRAIQELPDRKRVEVYADVTVRESNKNKAAGLDEFAGARGDGPGRRVRGAIQRGTQRIANKAAREGRVGMGLPPIVGGQGLMGAKSHLSGFAKLAAGLGVRVSSGLRPGDSDSYHGSGDALDLAAPMNSGGKRAMLNLAKIIASRYGGQLNELIHTPLGFGIKDGKVVPPYATEDHYDHVHVAVAGGGNRLGQSRSRVGDGPGRRGRRRGTGDGPGIPRRSAQIRIIEEAARKYGIDPAILWGLYGAETDFGRNVRSSSAGAQGPFQFMPATARSMGVNPHNFTSAAHGAARYLKQYKNRGTEGMLAAYNAGGARRWPNVPAETRAYVPKAIRLAKTWPGAGGSTSDTGAPGEDPTQGGLSPIEERRKRKLEAEIKKNNALLRKLRERLSKTPGGKKGKNARKGLQREITKLNNRNALVREQIKALGGEVTEGATTTQETRLGEAETMLQEAQGTPKLSDDVTAINEMETSLAEFEAERRARLKTVTGFLKGKMTKTERAKFLREKQQITRTLTGIENKKNELKGTRNEALVGRLFAGGEGKAGIDEAMSEAELTEGLTDDIKALETREQYLSALAKAYQGKAIGKAGKRTVGFGFGGRGGRGGTKGLRGKANPKKAAKTLSELNRTQEQLAKARFQHTMMPAEWAMAIAGSTENLGDDVAAMNQQLGIWQIELSRRTKRGDIAGMIEAQNAINGLTANIKQANEQMREQYIMQGVDSADYILAIAGTTGNLADDVNALLGQQAAYHAAATRAWATLDVGRALQLEQRGREIGVQLAQAQRDAQLQPFRAREAMAGLTESLDDDRAVWTDMLRIHEARLAHYQAIGDYEGIITEAGNVKNLRDQIKQEETSRLEQVRLLSEARQNLYRDMGSNQISGGLAPVGTRLIVNNHYKTMPMDPHTWSRDVAFELRAVS